MLFLRLISMVILSATIILSTTGVRLSQHWCGDSLVNLSIWGDADPCSHYKSSESPCPFHKNIPAKNCCNQKEVTIDGLDNHLNSPAISLEPQTVLLAVVHIEDCIALYTRYFLPDYYRNHSPPLILEQISVLYQRFII